MTKATKFLLAIMVLLLVENVGTASKTSGDAASEPTIDKPSIQVTLRTHHQFYRNGQRDEQTWAWTPRIKFRVNGPISSGSQLSLEFTLPGNKPWVKFDCQTGEAPGPTFWWQTECGNDVPDEQAVTETGIVEFHVKLRNELAGTNTTLFSGKMKVEKFHVGLDLPKFKNNFAYYVNQDWNLPIGYVFLEGEKDAHSSKVDWTFPQLIAALWFRGNAQTTNHTDAYLFYQGKEVGSTKTSEQGKITDEVDDFASESSDYEWRRRKFWFNTVRGWDRQPQGHIKAHLLNKNPGEYEIKVLQNGRLARVAKFTVGPDGKLADTGIAQKNRLGDSRIVVPVQISGDQDGHWDQDAWKTWAFYGHPLTGFTAP